MVAPDVIRHDKLQPPHQTDPGVIHPQLYFATTMEELETTSSLLGSILDKYIKICSAIESSSMSRSLLDRVSRELARIDSHEAKIRQAKVLVSRTSNYSLERKTINSLPPEIMLQISQLVCDEHECCMEMIRGKHYHTFPRQIEPLLQVCSRWRHALISSSSLWTHLDVVDENHEFYRRLIARAETYANRAGDSHLSLHFYESENAHPALLGHLSEFLTLVSPRLSVVNSEPVGWPWAHVSLFSHSLIHTVPGLLTQLIIFNSTRADSDYDPPRERLLTASSDLFAENPETLRLITTLRLYDVYLDWNSPVYHRLVELALTFCHTWPSISEYKLAEMLRSSPQLKKLWLRIEIAEPEPGAPAPKPVALDDLTTLKLRMSFGELSRFLRLINPGPQQLKMFIDLCRDTEHPRDEDWYALEAFFARSNVTRLGARSDAECPWIPNLLACIPNLELLQLYDTERFRHMTPSSLARNRTVETLRLWITTSDMDVYMEEFRQLIQLLAAQSINVGCVNALKGEMVWLYQEAVDRLTEFGSMMNYELVVSDDVPGDYWY